MKKRTRIKNLYQQVFEKGSLTKPELAEEVGLSLTAISDYINELVDKNWMIPRKKAVSSGGRRAVIYQTNDEFRYIIGLDLKDTHFYIFLTDLKGRIIFSRIHYLENHRFTNYIGEITSAVDTMLTELSLTAEQILAMGISISGVTDFANKNVDRSNLLDWTDKPLALELEAELKIPVFVETDVRVYAYNELETEDDRNITTVLYIGEGIGLALVVKNQILQGYTNRAGENRFFGDELKRLDYIIKNDEYLKEINAQPYYSEKFQKEKIKKLNRKYEEFISRNEQNEIELAEFTTYIARMMLSTINLLNPKKVLLTGNVFDYNDLIYHQVKEKIMAGEMNYLPEIKRSKHRKNPLENAIVCLIMNKFFDIKEFQFARSR